MKNINEADYKGKNIIFFCVTIFQSDIAIKVGITTERDLRGRLSVSQNRSVNDVTCEGFDYCVSVNDAESRKNRVKDKFGVIEPGKDYLYNTPALLRYIAENCKTDKHVKWAISRSKRLRCKYDRSRERK